MYFNNQKIRDMWNLSAKAVNEWRNLLFKRSLSSGSLGSTTLGASLCNSSPLSGTPRALPIVSNSRCSFFLKLICESKGCELDIENSASTRILACRKYLINVSIGTIILHMNNTI